MAYLSANQHRQYDVQYEAIGAMFNPAEGEGETNWRSLSVQVAEALNDPALPRYYRAEYHIINAWCVSDPEARVQLGLAREVINDKVQVLQADGRSQDEIDVRLKSIRDMLAATEDAVDDEYVFTPHDCAKTVMWTIADYILGMLRLKLRSQLRMRSSAPRLLRRRTRRVLISVRQR
jgi:hypothetical protein